MTGKIKQRFLDASRKQKKIGSITISLNAFVPKPFTPFQWCPMDDRKSLQAKIKTIRKALRKIPNVRVQAENLRWSYVQALLARGDRRVGELLLQAHANQGNWSQTFKAASLDPDFYVTRPRALDERLPWSFIDHGLSNRFLRREYRRAQEARESSDCPLENCNRCGVCEQIRGRTASRGTLQPQKPQNLISSVCFVAIRPPAIVQK